MRAVITHKAKTGGPVAVKLLLFAALLASLLPLALPQRL
jgi:hypothetical protein